MKENLVLKILNVKPYANRGLTEKISALKKIMPFLRLEFLRKLKQQLSPPPGEEWKVKGIWKAVKDFLDLIETQNTQENKQSMIELLQQEPIYQHLSEEVEAICKKTTKSEEVLDGIGRLVEIFSKVKNQTFWGKQFSGDKGVHQYFDINKLFNESRNYEEFITNYDNFIQWLLRNKDDPIYSHDITERLGSDQKNTLFTLDFYVGGFLKIGRNSVGRKDNNGVEVYTCMAFESYFEYQKLGQEIIVRTFLIGYEVAEAEGFNPIWAHAFYTIVGEDNQSMADFLYPILDVLFSKLGSGSLPTEEETIAKLNLTDPDSIFQTAYFGSWRMLFRNFLANVPRYWRELFYEERVKKFYQSKGEDGSVIWQSIEHEMNWEDIEKKINLNRQLALLSILERLIGKIPYEDSRIASIQAKIDELRESLEMLE